MPRKSKDTERFESGNRLLDAQVLLGRAAGVTLEEIQEELGVSRSTGVRYLEALARRGLPTEVIGTRNGYKVHRISPKAQSHAVAFTLEEAFWLKVMESYVSCFEGTGIEEAFRAISAKVDATLGAREKARVQDLATKIFDVPDHAHDYAGKAEVIDEILTALLDDRPVMIEQGGRRTSARTFRLDPYTLVTHKRALYVVGYSHHHHEIRTFSIDTIADADRIKNETFTRPIDFDPRAYFEGVFGLIRGEEANVVLRFDISVAPWLTTRKWHPTQSLEKKDNHILLTMRPRGTTELLSWILSWGDKAEVLSPPDLRTAWQNQIKSLSTLATKP